MCSSVQITGSQSDALVLVLNNFITGYESSVRLRVWKRIRQTLLKSRTGLRALLYRQLLLSRKWSYNVVNISSGHRGAVSWRSEMCGKGRGENELEAKE